MPCEIAKYLLPEGLLYFDAMIPDEENPLPAKALLPAGNGNNRCRMPGKARWTTNLKSYLHIPEVRVATCGESDWALRPSLH